VNLPPYDPGSVTATMLELPHRSASDAAQIVAYLSEMAFQYAQNPAVRTAVVQILHHNRMGNHDVRRQVKILTEWVKRNVVYVADPEDAEYIIAPPVMIRNIEEAGKTYGDCDDHVLLLASMLKAVGIPTKVVGVSLDDPNRYDHVIVSARIAGQWRDIDPCAKGWQQPVYLKRLEA
jgi:transglutaminase-like putative cysteine protease